MNEPEPPATLYVDLDGTLIYGDLSMEAVFALLLKNPLYFFLLPAWALRGKAYFKHQVALRASCDAENLPYHTAFIEFLRGERVGGRTLVLATASHRRHAEEVARHLGIFDGVIATENGLNLDGTRKLAAIEEHSAGKPFIYAGNERKDLAVWRRAQAAIVVNAPHAVIEAARRNASVERIFDGPRSGWRAYVRACRLHQWTKNLLLFVPLVTAHQWHNTQAAWQAAAAFVAFGLCASGIYVLNDLADIASDRRHPRKRARAFASGAIPCLHGVLLAPLLVLSGLMLATWLPAGFFWILIFYLTATVAYSFYLKRKLLLDVLVLAGLYTVRVIAGALAIGVALSFWLLAFSIFLFFSLALVKRCVELSLLAETSGGESPGRGYAVADLPILRAMGVASGFVAVLVYALYINSDDVINLYSSPKWLWLSCPAMLYWTSRIWINETRGVVHDDPIVYALKDPASYGVLLVVLGTLAVAL
jgi:4-hydroxybenzoate polyprenyltransferase